MIRSVVSRSLPGPQTRQHSIIKFSSTYELRVSEYVVMMETHLPNYHAAGSSNLSGKLNTIFAAIPKEPLKSMRPRDSRAKPSTISAGTNRKTIFGRQGGVLLPPV